MTKFTLRRLILMTAASAALTPCLAQQPAVSSPPPAPAASAAPAAGTPAATPPTAATPAPADAAADLTRKARQNGFKPETKNGVTQYCETTTPIGTKFPTKNCYNESQMASILNTRQDQRNNLGGRTCSGNCGAK